MKEKKLSYNKIFARNKGIFETDILANKLVTIIGLGSGGSMAALELAKCGVGAYKLVDYDVLEPENVIRHACGIRDIGRLKTEATRDAILNVNPEAKVDCFNIDILEGENSLNDIVYESDLLLPCTDSEYSKYRINEYCIKLWVDKGISIPAIYAGCYERAFGGDIMRVVPGETPCYDCVIGAVQKLSYYESKPKGKVAYSSLENADEFNAEPGLGLDVHFIVLIQVKIALLTLLRSTKSDLKDIPYNFIFWGNRKEWIFDEPFKAIYANIQRRDDCATCGAQQLVEENLGMSKEEINKEALTIRRELEFMDLNFPEED